MKLDVGSDVFISYKRSDRDRVLPLAEALRLLGLSVWFDAALQPGDTFDEEISRQLNSARAHIVCWTADSIGSRWVRSEAHIGANRKILVPIFLDACTPLPPFNLDHTIDLSDWQGDARDARWLQVVSRIGALLGRGAVLQRRLKLSEASKPHELRAFIAEFKDDSLTPEVRQLCFRIEMQAARERLTRELSVDDSQDSNEAINEWRVRAGAAEERIRVLETEAAREISTLQARLDKSVAEQSASEKKMKLAEIEAERAGVFTRELQEKLARAERALHRDRAERDQENTKFNETILTLTKRSERAEEAHGELSANIRKLEDERANLIRDVEALQGRLGVGVTSAPVPVAATENAKYVRATRHAEWQMPPLPDDVKTKQDTGSRPGGGPDRSVLWTFLIFVAVLGAVVFFSQH